MKTPPAVFPFLLLPCFALPAAGQSLSVSALTVSGNQVTITVKDTGASSNYQLQGSPGMTTGSWAPITATFNAVAGQPGFFRATITKPAGTKYFLRVLGMSGTAEDTDGDGLANTLEATLGTNPSVFDTDGDGFSDGIEFAQGTNPLLASSKPNTNLPPAVQFTVSDLEAVEGQASTVNLVFDREFTGTVKYNVLTARSTAKAPVDYTALSGTVAVSGTTASFQVNWVDDLEVEPVRLLFLNLVLNPGQNYTTGVRDFLTLRLMENDAYWQGTLAPYPDAPATGKAFEQRNFRLKFVNSATTHKIFFVAGAGFDGRPALAGETQATATSQSEGVVPKGSWDGIVNANSTSDFWLFSLPMAIPADGGAIGAGGSLFGAVPDMTRVLQLDAEPNVTPYNSVTPTRIGGQWFETLSAPSTPHLDRQGAGMFILQKEPPVIAPVPSSLTD